MISRKSCVMPLPFHPGSPCSMAIPKKIHYVLIALYISLIVWFGFLIRASGYARQARFNVDMVEHVFKKYFKTKGRYPQNLQSIPAFNIVSVRDNLYLDAKMIRGGVFRGYQYFFSPVPGREGFVFSASPVGFCPAGNEFAIADDGVLRLNTKHVDPAEDSWDEILKWKVIPRIERIQVE